MNPPAPDIEIDARGLLCPQPVLLLARAARTVTPGESTVIVVATDDPAAATDIPAWCQLRSATLLATEPAGSATRYVVRVGGSSASTDQLPSTST